MTDSVSRPYLSSCSLCEQGFLRIAHCPACQQMVAICDECEAIWKSPENYQADSAPKPDGQHPTCPHCEKETASWQFLSAAELKHAGLDNLIAGESP